MVTCWSNLEEMLYPKLKGTWMNLIEDYQQVVILGVTIWSQGSSPHEKTKHEHGKKPSWP